MKECSDLVTKFSTPFKQDCPREELQVEVAWSKPVTAFSKNDGPHPTTQSANCSSTSNTDHLDILPEPGSLEDEEEAALGAAENSQGMSSLLAAAAIDLARLDDIHEDGQDQEHLSPPQFDSICPKNPVLFDSKSSQAFERAFSAYYPHHFLNSPADLSPDQVGQGTVHKTSGASMINKYTDAGELPFQEKKGKYKLGDVFCGAGGLSTPHPPQRSASAMIFSASLPHGSTPTVLATSLERPKKEELHKLMWAKKRQDEVAAKKARHVGDFEYVKKLENCEKRFSSSWEVATIEPGSLTFVSNLNHNRSAMEPNIFPTFSQPALIVSARNLHQSIMQQQTEASNSNGRSRNHSGLGKDEEISEGYRCDPGLRDDIMFRPTLRAGNSSCTTEGKYQDKATQTQHPETPNQNETHICTWSCTNCGPEKPPAHIQQHLTDCKDKNSRWWSRDEGWRCGCGAALDCDGVQTRDHYPSFDQTQSNGLAGQPDVSKQAKVNARSSGQTPPAFVAATHHLGCGQDAAVKLNNAGTWLELWYCDECGMTWDRQNGELICGPDRQRAAYNSGVWDERNNGSNQQMMLPSSCPNLSCTGGLFYATYCGAYQLPQTLAGTWGPATSSQQTFEGPALNGRYMLGNGPEYFKNFNTTYESKGWGSLSDWGYPSSLPRLTPPPSTDPQDMRFASPRGLDVNNKEKVEKPRFHDPESCYCADGIRWNCWGYSSSRLREDAGESEVGDGVLTPTESEFGDEYPD